MKGKFAAKAERRASETAQQEINRLKAELSDTRARLAATTARVVEQDGLRSEIVRLRALIDNGTSDDLEKLAESYAKLLSSRDALLDDVRTIRKRWESLAIQIMQRENLKGLRGIEELLRLVGAAESNQVYVGNEHFDAVPAHLVRKVRDAKDRKSTASNGLFSRLRDT